MNETIKALIDSTKEQQVYTIRERADFNELFTTELLNDVTVLNYAVQNDYMGFISLWFLNKGNVDLNTLLESLICGHNNYYVISDICKALKKAEITIPREYLDLAIKTGSFITTTLLYKAGATLITPNSLDLAIASGDINLIDYIREKGGVLTSNSLACAEGLKSVRFPATLEHCNKVIEKIQKLETAHAVNPKTLADIRAYARVLGQGQRDVNCFFSHCPPEILVDIITKTQEVHSDKVVRDEVLEHLGKPEVSPR